MNRKITENAQNFSTVVLDKEIRLHFDQAIYDEAFIYYDTYFVSTYYGSPFSQPDPETSSGHTINEVKIRTKAVSNSSATICSANIFLS